MRSIKAKFETISRDPNKKNSTKIQFIFLKKIMNSIEGALRTLARTPNVAAARQVLSADSAALAGAPLATLLRARRGARSLPDAPPVDAALRAALRTRLAPETLVLRAVRLARRRDAALEATLRTAARVNPVT